MSSFCKLSKLSFIGDDVGEDHFIYYSLKYVLRNIYLFELSYLNKMCLLCLQPAIRKTTIYLVFVKAACYVNLMQ